MPNPAIEAIEPATRATPRTVSSNAGGTRGRRSVYRVRGSEPDVFVHEIFRPVIERLRPEVAHVETEHAGASEGLVAACGGMNRALGGQFNSADSGEAPAEVRVFAM